MMLTLVDYRSGNTREITELTEAEKLIAQGKSQEALTLLGSIPSDKKNSAQFYFLLGRSNQDLRNNAEALAFYTLSIEMNPSAAKAYVNRGLVKGAMKDVQGALLDLRKAAQLNPRLAEAHLNIGVTLAALNQPQEAIRSFDQALKLKSNYQDAYRNRGIVFHHLKKTQQACQDWKQAIKIGPSSELQQWVRNWCN